MNKPAPTEIIAAHEAIGLSFEIHAGQAFIRMPADLDGESFAKGSEALPLASLCQEDIKRELAGRL